MFDPIRSRNRVAAVFLLALAVFVPALVLPRAADDVALRKMILFASLPVVLISGVWLLVRWNEAKRLLRLRAGEGILARWTIDPARWAWFRHHSGEWDRTAGVRPNDADLAQEPGSAGIDIVVTLDAVLVGAAFTPGEKDVRITVRADWMEFHQTIHKPGGQPLHSVLRLPLQPGKEALASEVQQAYQRALRSSGFGRAALIYMALGIFLGLPAITALIWLVAKLTGWVD